MSSGKFPFPLRFAAAAGMLWASIGLTEAAAGPVEPSPEALAGISLLHQGRFDAASAAFAVISSGRPLDPEGPFFEAFVSWWRLLDRPKDIEAQKRFDERLQDSIARGEALLDGPDAQRGRILAGTALVLSAQSRAFAGRHLSAASAARRGYRHLEAALAENPGAADAGFAMGAYKYFAARMPWLVRALGVFFRIPRGDVEEGLAALRDAELNGRYFRVEASLLLTHIYADEEEDDMRIALDHLRLARAVEPRSPLLAAVDGRLQFALGRLGAAEAASRECLEMSRTEPAVTPAVPALARVRLALALYYQYEPRAAADELAPLLAAGEDQPEGVADSVRSLSERLRMDLGEPLLLGGAKTVEMDGHQEAPARVTAPAPAPVAIAAGLQRLHAGAPAEAIESLAAAVNRDPNDPVLRYHLGRAYQTAGRRGEAVAALTSALESPTKLPRVLQGWAMIRLGSAMDGDARRAQAEDWYRKASQLKGFLFRRAAEDRLRHDGDQLPPEG
ncbi:MAG: tetratricopeptide repeat protein [Acidobacteria bacterium]|nr:tetratricopeptide repeat protein [Acidobacteriota bacterium]